MFASPSRQRVAAAARRAAHHHELGDSARELGIVVRRPAPMLVSGPSVTSVSSPGRSRTSRASSRPAGSSTGCERRRRPAGVAEPVVAVDERGRAADRARATSGPAAPTATGTSPRPPRAAPAARSRPRSRPSTLPHTTVIATTSSVGIGQRPPQRDRVVDTAVGVDDDRPRHGEPAQASRFVGGDDRVRRTTTGS